MRQAQGFTLVEVLVTVVIMAMALLGLAGLQTYGLKSNYGAEQRAKAAQLVYDMADRMRANRDALAAYTGSAASSAIASCINTTGCSAINMAAQDLFEWHQEISRSLPGGTGSVSVSGAIYSITVNWDDNRDGATDASDASFTASFQP